MKVLRRKSADWRLLSVMTYFFLSQFTFDGKQQMLKDISRRIRVSLRAFLVLGHFEDTSSSAGMCSRVVCSM